MRDGGRNERAERGTHTHTQIYIYRFTRTHTHTHTQRHTHLGRDVVGRAAEGARGLAGLHVLLAHAKVGQLRVSVRVQQDLRATAASAPLNTLRLASASAGSRNAHYEATRTRARARHLSDGPPDLTSSARALIDVHALIHLLSEREHSSAAAASVRTHSPQSPRQHSYVLCATRRNVPKETDSCCKQYQSLRARS